LTYNTAQPAYSGIFFQIFSHTDGTSLSCVCFLGLPMTNDFQLEKRRQNRRGFVLKRVLNPRSTGDPGTFESIAVSSGEREPHRSSLNLLEREPHRSSFNYLRPEMGPTRNPEARAASLITMTDPTKAARLMWRTGPCRESLTAHQRQTQKI